MMKNFGILVFLVAVCGAISIPFPEDYTTGLEPEVEQKLARLFALALFGEITERSNPLFPVIPSLPDPAELNDVYITLPDGAGNITFCHSVATGTSNITDDLTFEVGILAKVHYWLVAPKLHIAGKHEAEVLLFGGAVEVQSRDDYTVDLTNGAVTLDLDVDVKLDGAFEITAASTHVQFDALELNTTETLLNGGELIWEDFNPAIKIIFDLVWPKIKPIVDQKVLNISNEIFKDCNLYIMAGGDLSCISLGYQLVQQELKNEAKDLISTAAGVCPPAPTPEPDDGSYLMYSEAITDWGSYPNEVDRCPEGSWANGFQVKTESNQLASDDTSMNGLKLVCSTWGTTVQSKEGNWGSWGNYYYCQNGGLITGFQLRQEAGGHIDNTAANNIRMFCSENPTEAIEGDGNGWGDWQSIFTCNEGFAICGLKTQVQPPQNSINDDTALNNVALLCCPL